MEQIFDFQKKINHFFSRNLNASGPHRTPRLNGYALVTNI